MSEPEFISRRELNKILKTEHGVSVYPVPQYIPKKFYKFDANDIRRIAGNDQEAQFWAKKSIDTIQGYYGGRAYRDAYERDPQQRRVARELMTQKYGASYTDHPYVRRNQFRTGFMARVLNSVECLSDLALDAGQAELSDNLTAISNSLHIGRDRVLITKAYSASKSYAKKYEYVGLYVVVSGFALRLLSS